MMHNQLELKSFTIKTPADGGHYHFALGGKEVTAATLKFGVVKLFNELGIIPGGIQGVEYQLTDIIKGYPGSREKDLLLNILDNSRFNNLPPLPPESPQDASIEQESTDSPLPVVDYHQADVTVISPPVKPPYRKHGQLTIFDADIKRAIQEALANGKTTRERSYRTIADSLKSRGILVSHMTISRRIKKLTK